MSQRYPLKLAFGTEIKPVIRRRMDYAFRVFCAIYGFTPVEGDGVVLRYGVKGQGTTHLSLTAGYRLRPHSQGAPKPRWVSVPGPSEGSINYPYFHDLGEAGRPDWLGEIFEWISGAHEYSIRERDSVGRIPYGATLHGRYHLDPQVPYAAVAMQALNREIQTALGSDWPDSPLHPWRPWSPACVIAATHDVDFLPVGWGPNFHRLLKDFGIAILRQRSLGLAAGIFREMFYLLQGRAAALETAPPLLQREQRQGIRSSWYILTRRAHRRDATYRLEDPKVRGQLEALAQAGVEIGLHGSYTSLEQPGRLVEEYQQLRQAGYPALGSRQHWLRYYSPDALAREIVAAGGGYDCSFGYREVPGFRQGACFPFPPYSFSEESPYPMLELPLVLMDTTLDDLRQRGGDPLRASQHILEAVRKYGWGGVSLLWHDTTFGRVAIGREIADLYWQLKTADDVWISAGELVKAIWPRYAGVGLLPARLPDPARI